MDMMCSYGVPLFDLDDNSTVELIGKLRRFRSLYEPYHGYLCTAICSFGILTNLINVVVLTKRQMRTSINVLLTGIAFCDMGTMASYLIYIVHFVLSDHACNPYLYTYGWMFFLMCHVMLSIALHTTTLWLSVVMAFIRNMTLRQARIGSPWLRSDNTWKICAIVYACVFVLCVPSVFSNGILPWHEYFNETCKHGNVDEMERNHRAYTIGVPLENCLIFTITFWLTGTLFKIIPCILLALLIFSLLFTIKRAEKNRKALLDMNRNRAILTLTTTAALGPHPRPQRENSQMRSDRTTAMLLMILGLSLLTELPQGAVSILSGIYVAHMQMFVYPNVADILDLLSLINSSVNFILYCIMSSKYRQVFWQVLLPRKLYVHWFVRPRQSARNRSRNLRRAPMGRPLAAGGFCPEAENLCAVSNLLTRRNRRHRDSELSVYDDDGGDDFTTQDMATERAITGTSPRYDQATPIRNGRDGRDRIFTFNVDSTTKNPAGTEEAGNEPWTPSASRLRAFLLPKTPKHRGATSTPTSQGAAAAGGTRPAAGSKNLSKKTASKVALLPSRSSFVTSDQMPTSANDHFTTPKTARRSMFPLTMFQKRQAPNTADKSKSEKKQAWLVGCSCLCKCAFRSGLESSSVNINERRPSIETIALDEEHMANLGIPIIVLRQEEELELLQAPPRNDDDDDGRRLLCSPAHSAGGIEETSPLCREDTAKTI